MLVYIVKRWQEKYTTDKTTDKIILVLTLYMFFIAWKVLILGDNSRHHTKRKRINKAQYNMIVVVGKYQ